MAQFEHDAGGNHARQHDIGDLRLFLRDATKYSS